MTLNRVVHLLAGTLLLAQAAVAKPNLSKELSQTYLNKVVPLKITCSFAALHFDERGQISEACSAKSWTVYSSFRFRKLNVSKKALTVTGTREIDTVVGMNQAAGPVLPVSNEVIITFRLSAPFSVISEAETIMATAFVSEQERAAQLAPYSGLFQDLVPPKRISSNVSPLSCDPEKQKPVGFFADQPIYHLELGCAGDAVPRGFVLPDPGYSEDARQNKIRGNSTFSLVVDQLGRPAIMKVFRRLGYGLEESAVDTVAGWKFRPATTDGKPVADVIMIELSFNTF